MEIGWSRVGRLPVRQLHNLAVAMAMAIAIAIAVALAIPDKTPRSTHTHTLVHETIVATLPMPQGYTSQKIIQNRLLKLVDRLW